MMRYFSLIVVFFLVMPVWAATPVTYYQFEHSNAIGTNEVIDSSSFNYPGNGLGRIGTATDESGVACRALVIPDNSSSSVSTAAVDTKRTPSQLGTRGTISFWYKADDAWYSTSPRTLFDASTITGGNSRNKYRGFFMTLTYGQLVFYVDDHQGRYLYEVSNQYNFTDQWVYITAQWDLPNKDLKIYINGVNVSTVQNRDTGYESLLDTYLNTLYVGDTRATAYGGNIQSQRSAAGRFDEFRVYNKLLSSTEIQTDYAARPSCSSPAIDKIWHDFEQESLSGAGSILDILAPAQNADPLGTTRTVFPTNQVSCLALEVPYNDNTAVLSGADLAVGPGDIGGQGTLSFWYRNNEVWANGKQTMLVDASTSSVYFLVWVDGDGRLQLYYKDASGRVMHRQTVEQYIVTVGTWVHVAISWDLIGLTFDVTLQGVTRSTSSVTTNSALSTAMDSTATFRLGDERIGLVYSGQGFTSADGYFDEVRVYPYIQSNSAINTDMQAVNTCQRTTQFFEFEQTSWVGSDDVLDSSGNDLHGDNVSSLVYPAFPDVQKSCRAMTVTNNNTFASKAAIDTQVDMNLVGDNGTISFWYRANQNWTSGVARTLFDASTYNSSDVLYNRFFFLAINTNGGLQMAMEDADDWDLMETTVQQNFAVYEWVHIAVTWDVDAQDIDFFINGIEVATTRYVQADFGPSLGDMNTLYVGDSRSEYILADSAHSHQSADGQIDNLRIYSYVQQATDINTDMADNELCSGIAAFYQFEQDAWAGNLTVLDSGPDNRHGDQVGSISPEYTSPQKSCKAMYVPANTASRDRYLLDTNVLGSAIGSQGSVTFWYKSNEAWLATGRDKTLVDAAVYNTNDRFLLQLTQLGQLRLSISDSNHNTRVLTTVNANPLVENSWSHIGMTWDMTNGAFQIVQDGVALALTDNGVVLGNALPQLGVLAIGDNFNSFSYAPNSADGYFDDVRIYYYAQTAAQMQSDMDDTSPCDYVDHYELAFASSALTCAAQPINLKACMDQDCNALFDGSTTVALNNSAGSLSATTVTFSQSADINLRSTQTGVVTLGKTSASPEAPLQCKVDGTLAACELTFADGGLTVSWLSATPTAIPDQLSQQNIGQNIVVSAPVGCAADLSGQTLELAFDCANPASCNADMGLLNGTVLSDPSAYVATPWTFDNTGQVIIPADALRYDDAGLIALNVRSADQSAQGSSNQFVAIPQLTLIASQALPTAGVDYPLTIQAVGQLGNITPNYQPGSLQMLLTKQVPGDGAGQNGLLVFTNQSSAVTTGFTTQNSVATSPVSFNTALADFNAGVSQNLVAGYSEVGNIALAFSDANYFGAEVAARETTLLGRYIPAYFSITDNDPQLAHASGTFSYIGQPLSFSDDPLLTFIPRNALGVETQNYIGNLMRLATPGSLAESDIQFSDSSGYSGLTSVDEGVWQLSSSGDTAMQLQGSSVTFVKSVSATAPFDANINLLFAASILTDQDGVCYQISYPQACQPYSINNIGGTQLYYGQLVLENAYGPENEDLPMLLQTRYLDTNGNWVLNTLDSYTYYSASNLSVTYSEFAPNPGYAGNGIVSGGEVTDNAQAIIFSAPGVGVTGRMEVKMSQPDYLFIDLNGDGQIDALDAPVASINFGLFRGNDRIIHWRENNGN
ncbi:DUF6701 domain-containing protein [Pseudobowmanella zhangzhouensis]|uniref:DUF6701 domain-containing protein n=1 Tax=Pseudobowmanella zhangzhouensis TaxID=1537679 RepID=UPI003621653E